MRFNTGHAEVQAEGFGETVEASIAASGKAFKGLIDGLYSRKIEAAVRELATNAFDAHKAAGSIAPFDIHLPTVLQPTFYIRDYGTGMSHDLVMRRYMTLFDSTKDGMHSSDIAVVAADDQVGMLGLGSKSFFAYTDACTLTIWMDGEVRLYSIYMGANGVPRCSLAHRGPSDEPTGVKVEFAAKAKHIKAFETAAIRVFKGFPIQPNGLSIKVREEITTAPIELGTGWKAFPAGYLPDNGFYARQGCVLYPIDLAQIDDMAVVVVSEEDDEDGKVELSEQFARFKSLALTIVLDFPIGSLEFDLSRERLAYSDHTLRSLRKHWDSFRADLDNRTAAAFAGLNSRYERMQATLSDLFVGMGPLLANSTHLWEANELKAALLEGLPKNRVQAAKRPHPFRSAHKTLRVGESEHHALLSYKNRLASGAPEESAFADAIFLYRDEAKPKNLSLRLTQHLVETGKQWLFVFEDGQLLKNFKRFGCPPITRLSSIPQPPKEVVERSSAGAIRRHGVFKRIKVIRDGDTIDGATEDDDLDGHLFAFMNCGSVYNPDSDRYPDYNVSDIIALHQILKATTGQSISFINIRSNDRLERWDDLPLFYDLVDKLAEKLSKPQIADVVAVMNQFHYSCSRYDNAFSKLTEQRKKERNPLTAMRRFPKRGKMATQEMRDIAVHLLHSDALSKVKNDIIHIAYGMGIEVLPPLSNHEIQSYPLLPKKWETYIDWLNKDVRYDATTTKFYRTLIKDHFAC
jgi:hypothetical protein